MTVRMGFSLAMTCRLWTIHKRRPLDKRSPANLDAAVGCDYRFIHHRSSNTKYKKMMIKKTYSVFKCQKNGGRYKTVSKEKTPHRPSSFFYCLLKNRMKPLLFAHFWETRFTCLSVFWGANFIFFKHRPIEWNFPYLKNSNFFAPKIPHNLSYVEEYSEQE